jgi:large subunit ribosomal protein L14e
MIEPGRLCVKTAGRDAGKKCVIVDVMDNRFVMIDGETRRRKCNINHLELLEETVGLKKGASHQDVVQEFKKLGIDIKETKPRKAKPKPKQIRAAERKKMAPKPEAKKPKEEGKETKTAQAAPVKEGAEQAEKPETKLEKAVKEEKEE